MGLNERTSIQPRFKGGDVCPFCEQDNLCRDGSISGVDEQIMTCTCGAIFCGFCGGNVEMRPSANNLDLYYCIKGHT